MKGSSISYYQIRRIIDSDWLTDKNKHIVNSMNHEKIRIRGNKMIVDNIDELTDVNKSMNISLSPEI